MFGGGGVKADTSLEYEKALSLRVLSARKRKALLWSPVKQFVEAAHTLQSWALVSLITDRSDPD